MHVLVDFVEPCYVRGTITNNQVHFVALENVEDCLGGFLGGDVSHDEADSLDWGNVLEVDTSNPDIVGIIALLLCLV